jgi:hypothetical protein
LVVDDLGEGPGVAGEPDVVFAEPAAALVEVGFEPAGPVEEVGVVALEATPLVLGVVGGKLLRVSDDDRGDVDVAGSQWSAVLSGQNGGLDRSWKSGGRGDGDRRVTDVPADGDGGHNR